MLLDWRLAYRTKGLTTAVAERSGPEKAASVNRAAASTVRAKHGLLPNTVTVCY
jgi:hypothetical protein